MVGKRQLEATFGGEVVELPDTLADTATLADEPAALGDDLREAFVDSDNAGVVATIDGGPRQRAQPKLVTLTQQPVERPNDAANGPASTGSPS